MKNFKLVALSVLLNAAVLQAQKDSTTFIGPKDSVKTEGPVRSFQFTFITPIGTNGLESHKTTNHVSLNLLAGVSKGLDGFEAGTIANVILKDMKGVEFAGFANVVLGEVNGAQFSSYFNYAGRDLKGASFAGFSNVAMGEIHGAQVSSFFNFNKKGGKGVQVAGHTNVILGDLKGVQVASFANIATHNVDGAQVSAFVNYAKKVKGIQLGIINIADSVDGASIGFLNFIRKGMHQLEFYADELFYTNLSYRTGTKAFHNIFSIGYQPGSKDNTWHIGYGAGTSFKITEKLRTDVSATAYHINMGGFSWGTSELFRLYVGAEYRFAKKFAIAAGPTFNLYMSDLLLKTAGKQNDFVPYTSFNHTTNDDFNLKGWIGARVALRFL